MGRSSSFGDPDAPIPGGGLTGEPSIPPHPPPPSGTNGAPPSRYEWNERGTWLRDVIGKLEVRGEKRDKRIDDIESRLDRYLGIAIAMPWILSALLFIGWVGDRVGWWNP